VGEVDEITKVFTDHAASVHGSVSGPEVPNAIKGGLQNAVFVDERRCYVGDQYEQQGPDSILIPGPGFVLRRFFHDAAASLDCKCTTGDGGSCSISLFGPVATCEDGSCIGCGWVTTIPTVVADRTQLLFEFE
jgi:hypothetical protein